MYLATFTCTDRNMDDGIRRDDGSIGAAYHVDVPAALRACADDADTMAALYEYDDETDRHAAYATSAAYLRADATTRRDGGHLHLSDGPRVMGCGIVTHSVHGDRNVDGHPWHVGTYSVQRIDHLLCTHCGRGIDCGPDDAHYIHDGCHAESVLCTTCRVDDWIAAGYGVQPFGEGSPAPCGLCGEPGRVTAIHADAHSVRDVFASCDACAAQYAAEWPEEDHGIPWHSGPRGLAEWMLRGGTAQH